MTNGSNERPDDQTIASDQFAFSNPVPPDAEWEVVTQKPYEESGTRGLTTTIVYAVADAEDASPLDIKTPTLYDVVDTAALERAYFGPDHDSRVHDPHSSTEFMYRGHRIEVQSDGWVVVYARIDE